METSIYDRSIWRSTVTSESQSCSSRKATSFTKANSWQKWTPVVWSLQVAQARAQVAAQRAAVERLHNGSRPEEIAQARANLASAMADAANARRLYEREKFLVEKAAATQQDVDNAKAALDVADAKVEVNRKALDLAIAGPRIEDVAQGEAELRANEAQFALVCQQLADAKLVAPTDGVVRSRLIEPGDMASPQRPSSPSRSPTRNGCALMSPSPICSKCVPAWRRYVTVDGVSEPPFAGYVGFISPVAEFTPKAVQTEELRTSLVYEVRVLVDDPDNVAAPRHAGDGSPALDNNEMLSQRSTTGRRP